MNMLQYSSIKNQVTIAHIPLIYGVWNSRTHHSILVAQENRWNVLNDLEKQLVLIEIYLENNLLWKYRMRL